jgi:hypothetical protein
VWVTGPVTTSLDFDYHAWVRWTESGSGDVRYNEYGILISPTPIDPRNPHGNGIYTFQIRLWNPPVWLVKKWTINNWHDHPAVELDTGWTGDKITRLARFWNYLRIQRTGNQLTFSIARQHNEGWQVVYQLTDNALPQEMYIGFFAAHDDYSYKLVFQFDEVYLSTYRQP